MNDRELTEDERRAVWELLLPDHFPTTIEEVAVVEAEMEALEEPHA